MSTQAASVAAVEASAADHGLEVRAHDGPIMRDCPDRGTWRELRAQTIGASESAGLIIAQPEDLDDADDAEAVSPYLTPYQLYALKADLVERDAEEDQQRSNRTEWGQRLEPLIAETIAVKYGWSYRAPSGYYLHPNVDRMGCSLDYEVDTEGTGRYVPYEIKNVAASEAWKWRNSVGDWIVPAWIEIQCQHQMAVTGCARAVVGVLFGGNEDRAFEIQRDEELIATIEDAIQNFWLAVDQQIPPDSDVDRDGWVIKRLYARIDPDSEQVLDWSGDNEAMSTAQQMKYHSSQMNHHKKQADACRLWLQEKLGGAAAADLGQDLMVATSEIAGTQVSYWRKPYRKLEVKQPRKRHAGKTVDQAAKEGGKDAG